MPAGRKRFFWVGGVAVGVALEILLLPRFFGSSSPLSTRLIGTVGVIGISAGGVWIGLVLTVLRDQNIRRWPAILGPLGAVQVFAGVALVCLSIEAPIQLTLFCCAAAVGCALFSGVVRHFSPRRSR